ncbi:uncharacterized protein DUF397 [Stackebrandtia albiflava]|uniref:Uncharacterized protein DUF397 n=1 Tax=Stackebrandtia albiflava TaxID=406432 RepID=A0A562V3Q1_9ACTN|nr:DUF397 domain-containing protein [Stackebrandtia albiflava]TWJ12506.1 uncharacterized protein DUF397 [Stackebrandtia albiflava]
MIAGNWRKSSRSNAAGGNCVEARLWRASSHSNPTGGNCVEVRLTGPVELRDSKAPHLGTLAVSPTDFTALLDAMR